MKTLKVYLILVCLIYANLCFAQSGWFWQNPLPQGNPLSGVQFINSNIGYAVANYGLIVKTTNGGNSWITFEIPEIYQRNSTKISFINELTGWVAGESPVFVCKTTNGGINWTIMNTNFSAFLSSLYFLNETTGFLGTSNNLYKSTNSGLNWYLVLNTNINSSLSFADALTGWCVYNCRYTPADPCGITGIFKTTNCGENWFQQIPSLSGLLTSVNFINVNTGYVCGRNGVMKSTNGGGNWITISSFSDAIKLKFLDESTGYIRQSFQEGSLFKTTNNGYDWSLVLQPAITDFSITTIAIYTVSSNSRIKKSVDAGLTWQEISNGVHTPLKDVFFVNQFTGFAAGGNLNGLEDKILKTTNAGSNWYPVFSSSSGYARTVFFVTDSIGWVAGNFNAAYPTIIYKTTNCGTTWIPQNTTLYNGANSIYFVDQNYGWVASDYTGYSLYTTNGGNNWIRYNGPSSQKFYDIYFFNHTTGFQVGSNGIYKSTNGGTVWQSVFNCIDPKSISVVDSNNIFVFGRNYLIKSSDGGAAWNSYYDLFPLYHFGECIKFVNVNTGYCIINGYGHGLISKSTNGGINWTLLNVSNDKGFSSLFFLDQNTGWVVGDSGAILKTTNAGGQMLVGLNEFTNGLTPDKYLLKQNYPNPFNPKTKIKFDIPANVRGQTSNVKLVIYDLLGREVAILVNEELKPGTYEADWDASNYSSGVYFYKLVSGDFTETKKMVLMK